MRIEQSPIEGVKVIHQFRAEDNRGVFVKTFHDTLFKQNGIQFELKESFYSVSHKNVIRGMHFHHPSFEHAKIVFCTSGTILDLALDLRKESESYGKVFSQELSFENNCAMLIPKGFAHGFLTLSEQATTFYFVDGEYNQTADDGILYSSFGFNWGVNEPIISARDLSFKSFDEFKTPF